MATNLAANAPGDSLLLRLLQLAGWRLQVRDGDTTRIRAIRGEVELEATGANFAEAVGSIFAGAMRSRRPSGGD